MLFSSYSVRVYGVMCCLRESRSLCCPLLCVYRRLQTGLPCMRLFASVFWRALCYQQFYRPRSILTSTIVFSIILRSHRHHISSLLQQYSRTRFVLNSNFFRLIVDFNGFRKFLGSSRLGPPPGSPRRSLRMNPPRPPIMQYSNSIPNQHFLESRFLFTSNQWFFCFLRTLSVLG